MKKQPLTKIFVPALLHLANRQPPIITQRFFELKKRLLKQHGKAVGVAIQHIKHECWECCGTGLFEGWKDKGGVFHWFGEANGEKPIRCDNCRGSGKYAEFWTLHYKYKFGRYEFLNPVQKCITKAQAIGLSRAWDPKDVEEIEGIVKHTPPKYGMAREAALWLGLIYDKDLFDHCWAVGHFKRKDLGPLCTISNFLHWWKVTATRTKRKIYFIRLRFIKSPSVGPQDDLPF